MTRVILFSLILFSFVSSYAQVGKETLYVGTFSVRGSQGIYVFDFNRAKQNLTLKQTVPSLESPTFLEIHPSQKYLYSVNRGKADVNDHGGSISAYGIDPATGRLSGINHKSSYGDGPCYVEVDKSGKFVFISNYHEGNLTVLSLFNDGSLGSVSEAKKYSGSSVHPERQESPHVHASVISQNNRFLYVTDLGSDKIYIYEFNEEKGTLTPASMPEFNAAPGSGPRHFAFHPSGNFAYLAEELTSTVGVFAVDQATGALTLLQDSVVSLPPDFEGKNISADIHTDPKGKFLYMSNRGADIISIFAIGEDGRIELKGYESTRGQTPRNFLIEPKGEFMFVAHQDSDTIQIFRINQKNGNLTAVGKPVAVPSPVCLKIVSK